MTALSFALALAGFAALALTMDRHQKKMAGVSPGPRLRLPLRLCGWLLLGLSLVCATCAAGRAGGVVLWLGLLTPAALAVAGALAWRD